MKTSTNTILFKRRLPSAFYCKNEAQISLVIIFCTESHRMRCPFTRYSETKSRLTRRVCMFVLATHA